MRRLKSLGEMADFPPDDPTSVLKGRGGRGAAAALIDRYIAPVVNRATVHSSQHVHRNHVLAVMLGMIAWLDRAWIGK